MKYLVNFNNEGWKVFERYGLPYIPTVLVDSVNEVSHQVCEIESDSGSNLCHYIESCGVYEAQYDFVETEE